MSNSGIIYSLDVVKDLSDAELYQRLFDSWDITNGKIEVWGELVDPQTNMFINLHKVRLIAGNQTIDYPLKLRHGIESGVYVPYDYVLVNPNWTLLLENFQSLQVTDRH